MKIKVGDNVVVIAGKDRGKVGIVRETNARKDRVIVEGINILTKHIKPSQSNPDGGIEKIEGAIHASNVMLNIGDVKDGSKSKLSNIKYDISKNKNGRKTKKRVSKATGEEV